MDPKIVQEIISANKGSKRPREEGEVKGAKKMKVMKVKDE